MQKNEEQVRKVVENYIEGTFKGNVELLKECFHPKATMTGYMGPDMMIATPEAFIQDIATSASMESQGDDYQAEIKYVHVTGNIATAVLYETGFKGSGTLEDHFQLINDEGKWVIIAKNFTTIG